MSDKKKNRYDLHAERLATTDEKGRRIFLHPEDVKGYWRSLRTKFQWLLILFYLVLPWIHYKGQQVILLNIPARKFVIFGTTFMGHDAPILIFLLLGSVFSLGLVTSIWGRAWCGHACPQTVFIDAIYRKIERLIEGKSRQRMALEHAPLNAKKVTLKALKWGLYLIVSMHIAHSLLGYFIGTHELLMMSLQNPTENLTAFLFMLFLTLLFLIDFGYFREQFCLVACPYGRFQSVIMDEHSLSITYDPARGEPRRSAEVATNDEGDCINCYHCVKVCPTGIDIRRGTQLECIACTNCIDACDEIMLKVGKPTGLIRYESEIGLAGGKTKTIKTRSVFYFIAILVLLVGFIYSLAKNQDLRVVFLRGNKTPYQLIKRSNSLQEVVNLYTITLDHKNDQPYHLLIESSDPKVLDQSIKIVIRQKPFLVKKGHSKMNLFFRFKKEVLNNGKKSLKVNIINLVNNEKIIIEQQEINLVGPL